MTIVKIDYSLTDEDLDLLARTFPEHDEKFRVMCALSYGLQMLKREDKAKEREELKRRMK